MIKEKRNLENLHLMSVNQLNELKAQIDQMIQLKQPSLRVGMKCEVDSPRVAGMIGEIVKVNNVKCKVKFNGSTFNVPKSMIILK
jgi:hypothetical protein|tara:strand:+ start:527 stop:781 length:255 start_codon:yes stop_codon:yes gene_type:complete